MRSEAASTMPRTLALRDAFSVRSTALSIHSGVSKKKGCM